MADKMVRVAVRAKDGEAQALVKGNDEILRHKIEPDQWLKVEEGTLYVGEGLGTSTSLETLEVIPYKSKTVMIMNRLNKKVGMRIWFSVSNNHPRSSSRTFTVNSDWEDVEAGETAIYSPLEYTGLGVNQSYMFIQLRYNDGDEIDYEELPNESGDVRISVWGSVV